MHGGGFYRAQKYLLGPKGEPLSEHLHWFKWEAYVTWLSGMALLAIIYWWGASAYLDRSLGDGLARCRRAVAISAALPGRRLAGLRCAVPAVKNELALGVDPLCIDRRGRHGATARCSAARAAYIHVGALIGTIMVWNVFFHIIPGQRRWSGHPCRARSRTCASAIIGKQRSVHNTYFTLPVLFIMISNHFPMTFGTGTRWLVLAVIMLAGALIRQYFVLRHSGKNALALPAARRC